jgi:hypothetical protein
MLETTDDMAKAVQQWQRDVARKSWSFLEKNPELFKTIKALILYASRYTFPDTLKKSLGIPTIDQVKAKLADWKKTIITNITNKKNLEAFSHLLSFEIQKRTYQRLPYLFREDLETLRDFYAHYICEQKLENDLIFNQSFKVLSSRITNLTPREPQTQHAITYDEIALELYYLTNDTDNIKYFKELFTDLNPEEVARRLSLKTEATMKTNALENAAMNNKLLLVSEFLQYPLPQQTVTDALFMFLRRLSDPPTDAQKAIATDLIQHGANIETVKRKIQASRMLADKKSKALNFVDTITKEIQQKAPAPVPPLPAPQLPPLPVAPPPSAPEPMSAAPESKTPEALQIDLEKEFAKNTEYVQQANTAVTAAQKSANTPEGAEDAAIDAAQPIITQRVNEITELLKQKRIDINSALNVLENLQNQAKAKLSNLASWVLNKIINPTDLIVQISNPLKEINNLTSQSHISNVLRSIADAPFYTWDMLLEKLSQKTGQNLDQLKNQFGWICQNCKTLNLLKISTCRKCHNLKPQPIATVSTTGASVVPQVPQKQVPEEKKAPEGLPQGIDAQVQFIETKFANFHNLRPQDKQTFLGNLPGYLKDIANLSPVELAKKILQLFGATTNLDTNQKQAAQSTINNTTVWQKKLLDWLRTQQPATQKEAIDELIDHLSKLNELEKQEAIPSLIAGIALNESLTAYAKTKIAGKTGYYFCAGCGALNTKGSGECSICGTKPSATQQEIRPQPAEEKIPEQFTAIERDIIRRAQDEQWVCSSCKRNNQPQNLTCSDCTEPRPRGPLTPFFDPTEEACAPIAILQLIISVVDAQAAQELKTQGTELQKLVGLLALAQDVNIRSELADIIRGKIIQGLFQQAFSFNDRVNGILGDYSNHVQTLDFTLRPPSKIPDIKNQDLMGFYVRTSTLPNAHNYALIRRDEPYIEEKISAVSGTHSEEKGMRPQWYEVEQWTTEASRKKPGPWEECIKKIMLRAINPADFKSSVPTVTYECEGQQKTGYLSYAILTTPEPQTPASEIKTPEEHSKPLSKWQQKLIELSHKFPPRSWLPNATQNAILTVISPSVITKEAAINLLMEENALEKIANLQGVSDGTLEKVYELAEKALKDIRAFITISIEKYGASDTQALSYERILSMINFEIVDPEERKTFTDLLNASRKLQGDKK